MNRKSEYGYWKILKRLYWDVRDPFERQYLIYEWLRNVPGLFGNMLRARFITHRCRSAGSGLMVNAGARFRSLEELTIGDNVEIGVDNFIQALGGVTIGHHVSLAPGVKIWSANHIFKSRVTLVQEQGIATAPVSIGDDVFVGANAFVLPGVSIPKGCVITAGAVVGIKAYPEYSIISGNPARVIGKRD
jgi:acetyltransferase-like isoleucine patch superfamily enzyme